MDFAELIKKVLEQQFHKVVPFIDEEKALVFTMKNHVDLAIIDLKLKTMNGIQILQQFKKRHPDLKTIILTGYPSIETNRQALALGADAYCVKPLDNAELVEKVRDVLALKKTSTSQTKFHK